MKKYFYLIIGLCMLAGCGRMGSPAEDAALENGFANPPDEARPGVYWYFMDGNLSATGMTKDLEAMKAAGIGYVLFLEVNVGVPRGRVDYMSEEWQELFVHAVRECERLGIRMFLGIGPGWNGSGGPWVEGKESMQHLVFASVEVTGGKGVQTIALPKPSPKRPFFGEGAFTPESLEKWREYYEDVAVLAVPSGATRIDTASVSGEGYFRIPEIDERALYYRKPYSSVEGVPQYIPLSGYLDSRPGDVAIGKDEIIDLTGSLQADGTVSWDAPEGQWTVMRFGARNNGAATRPAPLPGVGFESDKFDTTAIRSHFEHFTGKLFEKTGFLKATPGGGIKILHIDSWEMGAQNWTPRFREEFTRRRGYDPQPFYPVYAGMMVQSREISERFLWDLRQTCQELVVENHVGYVRRYAQRYGLKVSIEPYDLNPTADMELAAAADIPMAEFWGGSKEFNYYGYNTSWGAVEASSVAHLTGEPMVPAEAFTAAFDGWRQYPASVKNQGDWAFAAGINLFMYHTFQHQSLADSLRPGMTMGPYGLHWDRNQTWWYLSEAYHRYVARCQFMLQQGRTEADMLYLAPEASPYVFRAPKSACSGEPYFPDRRGYSFDACPPSLLERAKVQQGQIVFPSGASYRMLVLPVWETMRPALLRKIVELVKDGATVVGLPPGRSPSLTDYPACDREVQELVRELWGEGEMKMAVEAKTFGKGRIIFGGEILSEADNTYPPYELTAKILSETVRPDFATEGELRYTHRRMASNEIYFVSSRTETAQRTEVTFRVAGMRPELWHPVTGEKRPLPEYTEAGGCTTISLEFAPFESYFIVFRQGGGQQQAKGRNFPECQPLFTLDRPWDVSFDPKWGGPAKTVFEQLTDWSRHEDPGIRYYSGTAFYRQTFDLHEVGGKDLYLDLGRVKNIARVKLNGQDLGVVWTSPWQVDISAAAREGENELTVEVVNLWANRLIGDEQLPDDGIRQGQWPDWLIKGESRTSGRHTFATYRHFRKDSPLLESGLTGPVTVGEKIWE